MPDRYLDATPAVAPLALAGMASGAYTLFAVGLNVTKRMRLLSPIAVLGGALATGLYFLLIPPYSFVGAAWATVAAFTSLGLLVLAVSNHLYPVPWDWRRIGLAVSLAAGTALLSLGIDSWLSVAVSIPVRLGLTLAYPAVLVAFRFFPPGDLAALRSRVRKVLPVGA
jgi:O-antigen/teichoic acid export membrane protein